MLFRDLGALDRTALSVGRNECLSGCLFRRRKITKTWLDTVSIGATFLDLLCAVRYGYSNGPTGTAPHSCSLIRTAEVVGGCITAPN